MGAEAGWVIALRDPVSAATHYAGFVWGLFALGLLWRLCHGQPAKQLSVTCFTASMCAVFLASGTFHALCLPPARLEFFRLLDHSAIYGLIAGTYTPIFSTLLCGRLRARFLILMWSMAAAGIAVKWTLPLTYYPVTVAVYLSMGAVGLLPIGTIARVTGAGGAFWGLLGAFLHGLGGMLDVVGWPVLYAGVFGSHELLHVLVIAGTAAHFIFVVRYVVPHRLPMRLPRHPVIAFAGAPRRAA